MEGRKFKLSNIWFINRWKLKPYSRNGDWVIIGFSKWWSSPNDYCYKLCFFGFDVQIWFRK